MLFAILLIVIGIAFIVSIPILGLIPGIPLILIGLVMAVLALLGRSVGALLSIGSTKTCPQCRSKIPSGASVCGRCGYQYS